MKITPRVGGIFEFLREKIDLAEVVSALTDLEEHGDTLTGFCPLQEQHSGNPGFRVYPDGFAHCFSCEFHGDVTKFWQTYYGIATPYEAARGCYEPVRRMPAACWRKRQANATK
jgi:hypothetical protein